MDDQDKTTDDSLQTTEEIQEGEIVSESGSSEQTSTTPSDGSALVLESLESLIRENLAKIANLQKEVNQTKEMVDSVLLNDEVYRQHDEAAKTAAKVKANTKSEILKHPENTKLAQKMKDLTTEIKEIKESMNSYLQEYQRLSGSAEIEDNEGQVMQIIYVAKLVRRRG